MKKKLLIVFVLLCMLFLACDVSATLTKLATPVQIAPANNTHLFHYPRVVTLAWKPVPNADAFIVETAYYSGTWHSTTTMVPVTSDGKFTNTVYTYTFIGDQPGRWCVTAVNRSGLYLNSNPTLYKVFDFSTKPTLPAPTLTSPNNATYFYNFPRTTTVSWKPVLGASGYRVQVEFYSGGSWHAWTTGTTSTPLEADYTFNFVGMQPGRWSVTALGGSWYHDSPPSAYRIFTYTI